MKIRSLVLALTASLIAPAAFGQTADIGVVVDESGSMNTEHNWLPGMVAALEAGLIAAGVGDATDPTDVNQYSLTGFGEINHGGNAQVPHSHTNDANETWFDAGTYAQANAELALFGGTEDGWRAINYALNLAGQRAGSATNIILVTDEDRDNTSGDTYASTLAALAANSALLNAVVNAGFRCGDGRSALGMDSSGTGYVADGAGGFTTCENATAFSLGGISGNTVADYVNLALDSGGAAWNLNFLRTSDVNLAASFTAAFVAIKVQEIEEQELPEPGTLLLLGLGLFGLGAARRRRTQ